ncbi:ragulator complex protein LAMTOR4 [Ditylenchus destructor]|uniref:Late endosomal/lysosomal adaptor and MAPK and MTOR activator 4 n=1 Tax=Ditylenchus destructor TaxID=166010 RepID=A0AAD4N147_9BILA|nr:ragulator complex protein LAMTOR4 [Ditylenchus destructor]
MNIPDLSFLSKLPDQCGYLVIQDGAILKSDGDLANAERLASVVNKMLHAGTADSLVEGERFNEINVLYPTFHYTITCADQLVYVVKRRNSHTAKTPHA